MLTPAEAEALIGQHLACLPIESLPLAQCAGAVLRENVYAERDAPPFDRVTMDGIAVASTGVAQGRRALRVQAMQAAGDAPVTLDDPSSCIEVMTGAALPCGCDAIVPIEQVTMRDGRAEIDASVAIEPHQFVHRRASDSRQGALLLAAGTRLTAPEVAIAASAGMARVRVSGQPRIAVISNAYGIVAALRSHRLQHVADDHIIDDEAQLMNRLRFHLDTHDVLVLSGGVSMGRLDLVPRVLTALGVEAVFHRIAQRPGKPMWFGTTPQGRAVFALPGNPVSTLVCLARYVVPALYAAMGRAADPPQRLALAEAVDVSAPLAWFSPVCVETDEWGRSWARPRATNGSGDFTSLAGTDGFVELPAGPHCFPRGHVARLYRW
jgi:molybdopterin molybdotransferase